MSALDWAAKIVEEQGRENRIYGKPEQALITVAPANPAVAMIRSLSLEEKLEMLRRLQAGELRAPSASSHTSANGAPCCDRALVVTL
jgi:hypothetical protein